MPGLIAELIELGAKKKKLSYRNKIFAAAIGLLKQEQIGLLRFYE